MSLFDSDQASGHLPLVGVAGREECRVRPTEPEWNAEPLAVADRDVGPELAGGAQRAQGQEISGHHQLRPRMISETVT